VPNDQNGDSLTEALGKLARQQRAEDDPPSAAVPPSGPVGSVGGDPLRDRIVAHALRQLGPARPPEVVATKPPPRRWFAGGWPAGLAFAALVTAVFTWRGMRRPVDAPLAVEWTLSHSGDRVRAKAGDTSIASIGDVAAIEARTGRAAYAEIRIFMERGGLVLRCPPGPGCTVTPGGLSLRFVPAGPGTFHILVASSQSPLAPPEDDEAADTNALLRAGAEVLTARPLRVR
jgi:hypothetical protein